MSATDVIRDFWEGRTAVDGPRAARFHGEHDAYDLAAIAAHCGADSRVLDLGCGTCVIANALVATVGCRVHAVDYVPEFLAHALDDSRLTTEVGDVRTYVRDERYDLVLSLGVITYLTSVEERNAMYERCAAMLHPGGILLVKAQFGVRATVTVDRFSDDLGSRYSAVYPQLDDEAALLGALFDVTIEDPYPASFSRYDNTHFHHVIAQRR
jgi:cyclopropane fatty-acyl-phospholipid synthase-like methyltransferase